MAQTPYPQTDRDLRRRIERSAGSRAGYKQLVRELGLGGGRERRLLLEQLARMTARGDLVKIDAELWGLPSAIPEKTARPPRGSSSGDLPGEHRARTPDDPTSLRANRDRLLAGRLDLHRDGYGFVRPNGSSDRTDDLFIPPNDLNGAMQGDEVLVDEAPPGRDGRRSGRIARVLTRRNPTVVGIFHYARSGRRGLGAERGWQDAGHDAGLFGGNYVTPLDERIAQPILIPDGAEIVAAAASTPHRVLGAEAQAQLAPYNHPDGPNPLEGLAVDVEITEFPQPGRPARGRLIEVLGPPEAFGVDVEIIIRKHHLPHVFPANVLAEATSSAEATVASLTPDDLARRADLRGLPIVTIDGETARDFDDAVLVRDLPNGNRELQVHIADVSHYVRPGTALDLEARFRGTSVYFPDRAIPMLPPQLSSGICSLRPDEDRLVLSCTMEIDPRGEVVGYVVGESVIRSARRMTYTQVQAILDGDPVVRGEFGDLTAEFDRMLDLALQLNRKRKRRGSIDFDLPEPVVRFDPDGNMASIVRSERGWSHRLIEEFMLSANECVATWIERQDVASLYRIHEVPDPKRIVDFEETAAGFGHSLGIGNLPVKKFTMKSDRRDVRKGFSGGGRDRQAAVHEVPDRIPVTPQMYQKLTARIAGTPEERILAYLMLRSLKQARYSEKNEGHFALASPSYTHFTSPIRRYPDLIIHRLLRALLDAGASPVGQAILSTDTQPWGNPDTAPRRRSSEADAAADPIDREELEAIATETSQTERRADDAERELIEWKKLKFMQDRVGEEFDGVVLSCTKYGFFVELQDLFIEGLVPIASLGGFGAKHYRDEDRYVFRDTDRAIVGTRSGRVFRIGKRVRILLDRIDRQQRRLQFALVGIPDELVASESAPSSPRKTKARSTKSGDAAKVTTTAAGSPDRTGKPARNPRKAKSKKRLRDRKTKGKR